jgi:capsular polysaccharide export protein
MCSESKSGRIPARITFGVTGIVKSLLFAVNRTQYRYFRSLAAHFRGEVAVVLAGLFLLPSLSALRHLDLTVLPSIVEWKIAEMTARKRARHPWSRAIYRRLYWLLAAIAWLRYWRPIARSQATVLAVWNGNFFRQAIACAIAEKLGLSRVFFENGLLPDTTTLDGRGVNFANSVPRDPAFFAARNAAGCLPKDLVPRTARRPERFAAKAGPLPARYVFIPFQIDHDTQITHFSPWIRDMEHLFTVVTAVFADEFAGFDLVFKEHPSAAKDYPAIYRAIEDHPNLHLLNQVATRTLIENAAAVLVVNSTVGLEALLFGKKVMVLGQAFYALEGIARGAGSHDELAALVRRIDGWQVDRGLIDRFLAYLQFEYAIPGSWKNPHVQHAAAVEERLSIHYGQKARDFHGFNPPAPV